MLAAGAFRQFNELHLRLMVPLNDYGKNSRPRLGVRPQRVDDLPIEIPQQPGSHRQKLLFVMETARAANSLISPVIFPMVFNAVIR